MVKPLRTLPDWAQGFAYHGPGSTNGEAEVIWAPSGIGTLHSCMCLCVFCVCLCDWTYACTCHLTCQGQKTVSGISLFDCRVCHASWSSGFQGFSSFCLPFLHRDACIPGAHTSHSSFTHLGDLSSGPCALNSKWSYPLSHLPSPLHSSSTAMNPPVEGLPLIWPLHLAPTTVAPQNSFSLFTVIQFLANLTCLQNAVSTEYYPMYTAPSKFLEQSTCRKASHWTHV